MSKVLNEIKEHMGDLMVIPNVEVTPALARALLRLNVNNRPVKDSKVKQYTRDMVAGQWTFNGDLLRFAHTGRMIDGQKRCLSIIESGRPQRFNIQLGLDEEVFDRIDIGQNRSASDVLSIAGLAHASIAANAIKLISYHDRGLMPQVNNLDDRTRVKNTDLVAWTKVHGTEDITAAVLLARRLVKKTPKLMLTATIAGFIYLFSRKNRTQAEEFFTLLFTGENIGRNQHSPIYLLRQKFLTASPRSIASLERFALVIKAWNYYRTNTPIKRLAWIEGEPFPKIK